MKKFIITTTINKVNSVIRQFDNMKDWNLIVTGDRKSPKYYHLKHGKYLSWQEQVNKYPDLCKIIGSDSTSRGRLIGIIEAYKAGADIIATIDDDNYPYKDWGSEIHLGKETKVKWYNAVVFDPVSVYFKDLWHRGFPLEMRHKLPCVQFRPRIITPLLQANLWDGDPDVDTIHRLVKQPDVVFPAYISPYGGGKFSPVNSQNTMFVAKYAMDYFPGPFIGRVEDIWAAYIFQAKHPNATVYCTATVKQVQKRTYPSLMQDLDDEMFGHKHTHKFVMAIIDQGLGYAMNTFCPDGFMEAYDCYRSYFI